VFYRFLKTSLADIYKSFANYNEIKSWVIQ